MTAAVERLEALARATEEGFDAAERRYRERRSAIALAPRRESRQVRRTRARLTAAAEAADEVVPQLLLPAGLDAARPGLSRR